MAHLEARLEGRDSTFLSAPGPQHPPPPPACSAAASRRKPALGMQGTARGRGGRSRAAAEAAPGLSGFPAYRGCFQSLLARNAPTPCPPRLCNESRRHTKHRTPRSVAPPGRFCPARSQKPQQQNGGRGRSGRPPPPFAQRARSAHARALAPSCRPGPPHDVAWRGQSGGRS